jgi:hypothetical protein
MKNIASFSLIILLSIFASFRGYDGGDTADYLKYFEIIASADDFFDAFASTQPYKFGYTFFSITFLISRFFNFQIYLIIVGLISNSLLLLLYKVYTKDYYFLIFLLSLSTITHYYYNYNAIRQPISNILILLVIFRAFNYSSLLKSAISFDLHLSSIIYPPIYILIRYSKKLRINFKYVLVLYLVSIIFVGYLLNELINIENYQMFLNSADLFTFSFISPLILILIIRIFNVNDISNNLIKFYILIWLTRLIFYRYNELFLRLSYCQHILEPIFVFFIIKTLDFSSAFQHLQRPFPL